ncbi:MAG: hypothetical protein A3B30_01990 [Candidatus Komeilibacteria bacterium RIFCSPLOWO2_01_FULL_52_15]|uniref:Transmembrane protein n=2 Tax=Candidatus Komeiliibacteriota TaxID=1817908 RepID=A0A1G2BUZ2_9BACT|nr:MAG: hypothetical protein A2677_01240 [Candidatus Komeilibacteria bacterium RIFCSPHIGHO2_01_FULL_52_14]OGY92090.1 MAG: hypothetical protein A3B30_01990 [Candidatus Komeilibacteria bacterium RIFCSPLOWO2_01_FULL_52_15]
MKKIIFITLFSATLVSALAGGRMLFAQGILEKEPTSGGTQTGLGTVGPISFTKCVENGTCGVEHILVLANNIIRWLAFTSGALALLMYILGGSWMIFSSGNAGRVERGKDILIGTTIALIFILGSWILISFTLQALSTKPEYQIAPASCGGATCNQQQTCRNNKCVSLCTIMAEQDTQHVWLCADPEFCGITYDDCTAANNSSANCITGYCSGEPNIVCCYKP